MPRDLGAANLAEVAKSAVRLVHLVALHFDSGVQRYTDGPAALVFGGNTYSADVNLLDISAVSEDRGVQVGRLRVTLSGVAQANVAVALSEPYTDRLVEVYRGFLDGTGALVADPYLHYAGRIDAFQVSEDYATGAATVAWEVAPHWVDFERTAGRRTNHQVQQTYFPGDLGFEFASEVAKDVPWGRP